MDKRKIKSLTNKQKVFVSEYLICWNAAEAARRAGYSSRTARAVGHENLTKPDIREVIEKKLRSRSLSADEVLSRLAEFARADMRDFVVADENGDPIGFDLSPSKPLHVVKKLAIHTDTYTDDEGKTKVVKRVTFELHDAYAALVKIGEYHRLFAHRVEIDASEELKRIADRLGLTDEDISADPLLSAFFNVKDVKVGDSAS